MSKRVAIIGGGIFGCTIYRHLIKKKINVSLFEKNSDILKGATTNNLNRVHKGYHYPRDVETVEQSKLGYSLFKKNYNKAILGNFKNYYCINNDGKISFQEYLNFCKENNLYHKIVNPKNFDLRNKNIDGIIEVNEEIYDWDYLRKILKLKIKKLNSKKIYIKHEVKKIKQIGKRYLLKFDKKNLEFDFIINSSFEDINNISPFKNEIQKKSLSIALFLVLIILNGVELD